MYADAIEFKLHNIDKQAITTPIITIIIIINEVNTENERETNAIKKIKIKSEKWYDTRKRNHRDSILYYIHAYETCIEC